jgi:predicted dithiol-disulfide oxidoreductase (DUF899 family)
VTRAAASRGPSRSLVSLLEQEKDLTRQRDALNAERRRLPMVKVEKTYVFDGLDGRVTLDELFGDRMQLVVQHIMFGPDWDAACPSCTNFMNELSPAVLARLHGCQTAYVLVSWAPLGKIQAYQATKGWAWPGIPPTAVTSTTTSR